MAFYLAFKEVWRNKGRFFLFSLVIALITTLVLFIAGLAEGLSLANKQYLENLDAQLLVFQQNVDLSTTASRIGRSKVNDIRRVEGIADLGSIGFSNGTIVFQNGLEPLNISLIGVEAGKPGAPPVIAGDDFLTDRGAEVIIDMNVVDQTGLAIGDWIRVKTIQGTDEEFYDLVVVGITAEQQYFFQPSIFIPYRTWDQIRPQGAVQSGLVELTSNVVAIKLESPAEMQRVSQRITNQVEGVEVSDIKTAYESAPGYQAQQSTLNTQSGFTLLIGLLVIGGFFQIQLLQKVPQIGVLKAIGASNSTVAVAVVLQIVLVTTFGVLLGGLVTLGLALGIPGTVPVEFSGSSVLLATISLLLIGPIGGLVSVRLAVSVEPLLALGLSS
ncbi:ABC transporter permease [Chloroflexota bacterium]